MKKCKKTILALLTFLVAISVAACSSPPASFTDEVSGADAAPSTSASTNVAEGETAAPVEEDEASPYSLTDIGMSSEFSLEEGVRWTKEDTERLESLFCEYLKVLHAEDVDGYFSFFSEKYFEAHPEETREFAETTFATYDLRPKYLSAIILDETDTYIKFRATLRFVNENEAEYKGYDGYVECEVNLVDGRWVFDKFELLEYISHETGASYVPPYSFSD